MSDSRAKTAARWLLAFTVVGSVLAVGSVHVPVLVVAACVAIAAGTATFFARAEPGARWPAPAVVFAGLAAYTALQALPVPLSLLAHLEPATADIWSRAFTALGERAPAWGAISLEPGASCVEALKWWAYAATFVAAAGVGAQRGARWGAALLLFSATLVALVSIAHGATDATKVYGFYAPRFGGERWHIGPLIDPNNLAGYLNLGALAGLGLIAEETPIAPRWVIALAVAPVVGMSFISESRGGFGALIVGLVLLAFLLRRVRGSFIGSRARRMLIPLAATLIGGVALALTAASHHVVDALLNKDVQKLKALAWTVPMMRAHPWFGVGRGAFQSVFQQFFVSPNDIVYSHPENFAVQWATEWGLPVAIVGLSAIAWLLRPRALGYLNAPAASGVFAGLAALVLQNVVDLSLEVPGVMFATIAGAGFLWGEVA
ncbi:MAG TPA: O-antigen ligase family protein, partial [Polyangiaceae bacterium]|nr:O-antigen ligase family protein [Polyangiaceae bacterium]